MCGRFTILTKDQVAGVVREIEDQMRSNIVQAWPSAGQVYPGDAAPVIVSGSAGLETAELLWGYEVSWSRGLVFNTRIERAISGSGMWTNSLTSGRCVVPAWSFFEPHKTETVPSPKTGRPIKAQYEFSTEDGSCLLMAGVQQEGRFSVVTTEPDAVVAGVHDRSPMLLTLKTAQLWLSEDYEKAIGAHVGGLIAKPEITDGMQMGLF